MDIDVTDRRQAEAVLKDLNAMLERRVAERTAELTHEVEERRRAEALRESEERLRLLTDNLPDSLVYDGRVVWDGVQTDVTESRRAQEALKASEAFARARADDLAAMMDAMPAITYIAQDPECRTMTSSRAALELMRLPSGANTSKSAPERDLRATFRVMKDGRELRPFDSDSLEETLRRVVGRRPAARA